MLCFLGPAVSNCVTEDLFVLSISNKGVVFSCKPQKMDLGDCSKIHAAALKADYEAASKKRDYGYDVDVSLLLYLPQYKQDVV